MAEPLKLEHALPLTQYFLEQLYQASLSTLSPYLSSNIVWINTDMQFFYGYHRVISYLKSLVLIPFCKIRHSYYHLASSGHNTAIVTGQYSVNSQIFYLTAVWVLEYNKLKLLHFHISLGTIQEIPDYRNSQSLKLYGKHGECYFISPEEITYIEARNVDCQIHCNSKNFLVSQSISQVATILPKYFIRIHRSFIVNSRCVKEVRRYEAKLSDGTLVPIPEKKYMAVLCQLELDK